MEPGLNEKTASRHNSIKDSKSSSFKHKDSFKSHEGKENHDSKSERESRGSATEQEVSPRIPRKFIANWRQACDRTKDRTKELLKRWRTLPESEIANAAAVARAQQEKDHGWSVHVWGKFAGCLNVCGFVLYNRIEQNDLRGYLSAAANYFYLSFIRFLFLSFCFSSSKSSHLDCSRCLFFLQFFL
jgi:hypothetical protein